MLEEKTMEAAASGEVKGILRVLKRATRRVRRILFLRGLLATLAALLFSVLAIMGIDAATQVTETWMHVCLSAAALAATLWVCCTEFFRPLFRKITPCQMAKILEERHPEWQERLSSAVELQGSGESDELVSRQLCAALTDQAAKDARTVKAGKEFSGRTVKPKLAVLFSAIAAFFLLFAVFPESAWKLFLRAIFPFEEFDNIYAEYLEVVPGDCLLASGETLEIAVAVKDRFPGQAKVLRTENGREITERIPPARGENVTERSAIRRFQYLLPNVTNGFTYRVECGQAMTRSYRVTVVERPAIKNLAITLAYPEYTRLPALSVTNAIGDIRAVEGTKLHLEALLNRTDLTARLQGIGAEAKPQQERISGGQTNALAVWDFVFPPKLDALWSLSLTDTNAFANVPESHRMVSFPDAAPAIAFVKPEKMELQVRPTEMLSLEYKAEDDFSMAEVDLLASFNHEEFKPVKQLRGEELQQGRICAGKVAVDLADSPLEGIQEIRYQFKATDVFGADGRTNQFVHTAWSAILTVRIDRQAMSLERQNAQQQKEEVQKALEEMRKRLEEARNKANEVGWKVQQAKPLETREQEKFDDSRKNTDVAEKLAQELANALKDTAFEPMQKDFQALHDQNIAPLQKAAEQAQLANEAERKELFEEMKKQFQKALERIEKSRQKSEAFLEQLQSLEHLDNLAIQQKELADKVEEMAKKATSEEDPKAKIPGEEMYRSRDRQNQIQQEANQEMERARNNSRRMEQDLSQARETLKEAQKAMSEDREQIQKSIAHQDRWNPNDNSTDKSRKRENEKQKQARDDALQKAQESAKEAARRCEKPLRKPPARWTCRKSVCRRTGKRKNLPLAAAKKRSATRISKAAFPCRRLSAEFYRKETGLGSPAKPKATRWKTLLAVCRNNTVNSSGCISRRWEARKNNFKKFGAL